jgi:DNA polymerase
MSAPIIHRDYETRSTVDLRKVGAHVYAAHPSTRILCAVWIVEWPRLKGTLGHYNTPIIWQGAVDGSLADYVSKCPPFPDEIGTLIAQGATVAGHNAAFEMAMDGYHAVPKLEWPAPALDQIDCTMARAAVQALPLDLDRLGMVLDLPSKKDKIGHRLMLQMCKPRQARKGEDPSRIYWHYDADKLARLTEYCVADVRTEIEADHRLRPLQPQEISVWHLDQHMNFRGVHIDLEFVRTAHALAGRAMERVNRRIAQVTGGAVEKVTQVNRLKTFAIAEGVEFKIVTKTRRSGEKYETESVDKNALLDLLEEAIDEADDADFDEEEIEAPEAVHVLDAVPGKRNADWQPGDAPSVRAAFELRLEAGKSSLSKLDKFIAQAPVGRARGNLQYHAAGPGRWGGRGIQMQNLVRLGISEPGGWDQAFRDMRDMDDETFELTWGSPFDVIARMMRGALVAAPGCKLYFADYAQVEARGCVWAAKEAEMVELFATDAPIYETMGASIFGLSVEEVAQLHNSKRNIIPRFVGKETILGCGYGMGPSAFQRNCKKKGRIVLPFEICEQGVYGWREKNPRVVDFWYALEKCAKAAIANPNKIFKCGPFAYRRVPHWLQCRLPSGRLLWYRRPTIEATKEDVEITDNGETVPTKYWKIHYWGIDSYTKQWKKESTWGGKLFENCIQGMCRDFLASAMLRLEAAGYPLILSVHDELIAETLESVGSVAEFVAIMSEVPAWAPGFPLKAAGAQGHRYAKA